MFLCQKTDKCLLRCRQSVTESTISSLPKISACCNVEFHKGSGLQCVWGGVAGRGEGGGITLFSLFSKQYKILKIVKNSESD